MRAICGVIILFFFCLQVQAQVENVHLDNDVYEFLKEMKVKGILEYISEDNPNLSRKEVQQLLLACENQKENLSNTELERLEKYKEEFFFEMLSVDRKWTMFGRDGISGTFSDFMTDRQKYMYATEKDGNTFFMEMIGRVYQGQEITPNSANVTLYGGGIRFNGTLFNHLGYHFSFLKGQARGCRGFAERMAPWLKTNFKWYENLEKIGNYDFVEGYLKYSAEPTPGMNISVQLGREPVSIGYGYGDKLVMTKVNNAMDFLKVNFSYGMFEFMSMHASTVGEFSFNRSENYTKYIATNRLKMKFEDLFDLGIGESIVYSDRSLDLAYLNPLIFYKFAEMSLQDRDNGTFYIDLQTKCFDNLELQGTLFMDESVIWRMNQLDEYVNKTAYQVGAFWYEAFMIDDLSLILEYTRTRPYIYTHLNYKNTYTTHGLPLGHRIGPNSDEIFAKLAYNFNADLRASIEYRRVRTGQNVVDSEGNLVKNVGSDPFQPYRDNIDSKKALFLDGVRYNYNIIGVNVRWEPVRDVIFELLYQYNGENNITLDKISDNSYVELIFSFDI